MYSSPFSDSERQRKGNPHLQFLASGIAGNEWHISPTSLKDVLEPERLADRGISLLHLHWPEAIFDFIPGSALGRRVLEQRFVPRAVLRAAGRAARKANVLRQRVVGRGFVLRAVGQVDSWVSDVRKAGVRVVWQVHNLGSHHVATRAAREADLYLHKAMYDLASGLVVHEESCIPVIERAYGNLSIPHVVAHLGDYTQVYGTPISRENARDRLRISCRGKVLSFIGTARRNRDPRVAAEAFLRVADADDRMVIAGQGVGRRLMGVSDPRIIVMDGFLVEETIRSVFCSSDFVVNHAHAYLTSAVVRTSMGYGVPVIAEDFGSTKDMAHGAMIRIANSRGGLESAMAEALRCSDERRSRMAAAAYERHAERSWAAASRACVDLYERLVGDLTP